MTLTIETGSWDADAWPENYPQVFGFNNCEGNGNYCTEVGWYFILDNISPLWGGSAMTEAVTPSEYNDRITLELNWTDSSPGYFIDVPATADMLSPLTFMPLSGRLSGNWVTEGAEDQGIILSISEMPEEFPFWLPAKPFLMFLSWYTYDELGDPLWLTGAARFAVDTTELTLPIELVTHGEFLGEVTADRDVVGTVTLTGNSCNDLGFEYNLTSLGLGSGNKHLQRLFSLETAGYTCRDLEARIEEISK